VEAFWQDLSMGALCGLFALAAFFIWGAGVRLEKVAVLIGKKLNLGEVFAGTILLAVATSLPEIATTVTATLRGEAQLAVFNILGSCVIQILILALSDGLGQKHALTGKSPSLPLIMQGCVLVFLLAYTIFVICLDQHWDKQRWLNYAGPISIALVYGLSCFIVMHSGRNPSWKPTDDTLLKPDDDDGDSSYKEKSLMKLCAYFAAGSLVIGGGGWITVVVVEQIAQRTGASQNFLGFTLVALATSLPELGTTSSAARRNHGVVAISNIFGSNSFVLTLLALVAVLSGESIFKGFFLPTVFACCLAILLTVVYLIGLIELKQKTIARLGWDSLATVGIGAVGLWVMFAMSQ
jgi:cation:H+ antiporter